MRAVTAVLGRFELVGIPPAPRGVPQIEVSFEIDANGIVNVSAKDKMTGLEQAMQITPSSGLAPDEIALLIMEAEHSVEKDREAKQLIMHSNKLDSLIKNTRKAMVEFGGSLDESQHHKINGVLIEAEEVIASEDLTQVMDTLARVEDAANTLTNALLAAV